MYSEVLDRWNSGKLNLDSFVINFCYNSGKIENNEFDYNHTREIFENGSVTNYSGNVTTLFEQINQKSCIEFIINESKKKCNLLDLEFIKKVHLLLMNNAMSEHLVVKGEKPGEFKKGDYVVGLSDVGVPPEDVEDELQSLVDEVREVKEVKINKVLNLVAYFHCWFESIHAFADGNGRTGRMLMNYQLMNLGHPPIIIYDEDKSDYYFCLEEFNESQDIMPMVKFLERQCVKTWERAKLNRKSLDPSSLFD